MARPALEAELKQIGEGVTEMGTLIEATISCAIKTLKERDSEAARALIEADEWIDNMEDEINDKCLGFLATQSPLAGDLRYVVSIMKVIRDLERIGDHCEDIAKYTMRFENEVLFKELIDIPRMADMSSRMVKNAIDAFVHRDLRLARRVWKADEEVDEIFRDLHDELLGFAEADAKNAKQCIMLLFIAAHLERIADYATNICEETVFVLEGTSEME
jgi:phosphate transport system protein